MKTEKKDGRASNGGPRKGSGRKKIITGETGTYGFDAPQEDIDEAKKMYGKKLPEMFRETLKNFIFKKE